MHSVAQAVKITGLTSLENVVKADGDTDPPTCMCAYTKVKQISS